MATLVNYKFGFVEFQIVMSVARSIFHEAVSYTRLGDGLSTCTGADRIPWILPFLCLKRELLQRTDGPLILDVSEASAQQGRGCMSFGLMCIVDNS